MFRKLVTTAILGLGGLTALAPAAQAHDPVRPPYRHGHHHHRHHHHHRPWWYGTYRPRVVIHDVYYRGCDRDPWIRYGSYDCYDDAYRVLVSLRHRGFAVVIR